MTQLNKPRLWTLDFLMISFIGFAVSTAIQMINNITPLLVDVLGMSASLSGTLAAVFTAAALITRIFAGYLTDSRGNRSITLLGIVIFGLATIAHNFFPSITALLLLRFLQGVGFALVTTANDAAVPKVSPLRRIGEGVSYYGLGQSIATALGPSLGLALIIGASFAGVFWAAGAILFLSLLATLKCSYLSRNHIGLSHEEKALANASTDDNPPFRLHQVLEKTALKPFIVEFFYMFGLASMIAFAIYYGTLQGVASPGLFFTWAALMMLITRTILSPIIERFRPITLLVPSILCGIAGLVVLLLIHHSYVYYLSGALYGLSLGISNPALYAIIMKGAPARRRGAAATTFNISIDAGIGFGALAWGFVIDLWGFDAVFMGAALLVSFSLFLSWIFFGRKQPC